MTVLVTVMVMVLSDQPRAIQLSVEATEATGILSYPDNEATSVYEDSQVTTLRPMNGELRSAEGAGEGTAGNGSQPELGELLRRSSHAMRHRFADVLKPWGLSPHQFRALRVINSNEPLRLRDLADQLRISPRSVTEVVDGLTAAELAERVPDPGDRRAITVSTTAAGRRLLRDVEQAARADSADFFGRLTAAERRQLAHILAKLSDGEGHGPGIGRRG